MIEMRIITNYRKLIIMKLFFIFLYPKMKDFKIFMRQKFYLDILGRTRLIRLYNKLKRAVQNVSSICGAVFAATHAEA